MVFVYVMGDRLIGWLHIFSIIRLSSKPFAEIAAMVVDQGQRRQGAGSALLQAAQGWAMEKGLEKIRVRANQSREETLLFYKALGFDDVKSQNVMDIAVRTEADRR